MCFETKLQSKFTIIIIWLTANKFIVNSLFHNAKRQKAKIISICKYLIVNSIKKTSNDICKNTAQTKIMNR